MTMRDLIIGVVLGLMSLLMTRCGLEAAEPLGKATMPMAQWAECYERTGVAGEVENHRGEQRDWAERALVGAEVLTCPTVAADGEES